nr:single-stranded DNA-binding protein [uncultured Lachnoclostridium sp.]
MAKEENKVAIAGKLASGAKEISIYGVEGLYAANVDVVRTSGVIDTIKCIFNINAVDISTNENLKIHRLRAGSEVIVYGAVQTYRDEKGHMPLFIWCEYITLGKAVEQNHVKLEGKIAKRPIHRFTPLGREITDIMLKVDYKIAVQEADYEAEKKWSCYIPCIVWGRNAKWAENLRKGDKVSLEGRLQSRDYVKQGEVKTTHEVSVQKIQKMS